MIFHFSRRLYAFGLVCIAFFAGRLFAQAPTITLQPTNRTVAIGSNATFSMTASGSPAPTYQWQRQPSGSGSFANLTEGGNFFFVTSANLSVSGTTLAMNGDHFQCVVTNSIGSATSTVAALTVTQPPAFTSANNASFTAGTLGSFTVTATASPASAFTIASGAFPNWATLNSSTGVISGTPPDATGSPFTFTIQASNDGGTVTQTFTLTVMLGPRLVNLSVRMNIPTGGVTSTFSIGGTGAKTVLIRGVGPTLSAFGISGAMADPRLDLVNASSGVLIANNDDWGGDVIVRNLSTNVGAFSLSSNTSKDAAMGVTLSPGIYTIILSGVGEMTGQCLLEIYDAGGSGDAKFSYLSIRGPVGTGADILIAGFAISGSFPRSLLVRAAGPSLNASNVLTDPTLTLYNGSSAVASNDNWDASLASVASQVGAFPFVIGSRDSAVVATLAPGSYSAQVLGVGGTSGFALLEIFDTSVSVASALPYFVSSPVPAMVNAGGIVTFSAVAAGAVPITYQWRKNGGIIPGATNSTFTLNSIQVADAGGYDVLATNSAGTATSPAAALTVILPSPPTIVSATGAGTINVGQNTVFNLIATGAGPLTYQWRKGGVAITGATNTSFSLSNVQLADTGVYDCVVGNPGGITTSVALSLTVVAVPPSITTQPVGATLKVGAGYVLSVVASGSPPLTYQWRRGGVNLPGATSPALGFPSAQSYDNGDYDVVVTNPFGSATSAIAHLTVNLRPLMFSARVIIASGESADAVFTIEGPSAKNLLLRVAGPGLATFGVLGVVPDPQLDLFNANGDLIASNNDWGLVPNAAALAAATSTVGAFGFVTGSRDSAVLQLLAPGSYTVRARGNGGTGGVALLELYDTDGPTNASRIPFAAVRARVAPGDGLLVGGLGSNGRGVRSFLIRAAGPALGLAGAFPNPALTVAREGLVVGGNDDWDAIPAEASAVSAAATRVAAFPFSAASRDAAIVLTGNVHAGAHVVQVGGASGAGTVLLELHDLDPGRPVSFAPIVVSSPTPQAVAAGSPLALTVRAHGSSPLTYQWRRDGVNVAGATAQTFSIDAAQLSDGGLYSVVVTNAFGTAASLPAQATIGGVSAAVTATQAFFGNGYIAGGTVTITNTLTFSGSPGSLGWEVSLPPGWSFVSDDGAVGQVRPTSGALDTIGWAWTEVPVSPVTFTYTLAVPSAESAGRNLTATAIVRSGTGDAVSVLAGPNPLVVFPVPRVHSADTDQNFRLSLLELTRVIELYNTRNGAVRTGCYKVDPAGEDGFSAEPTRAAAAAATLTAYHTADSNRDGKISLLELTRVIELYNYRTGSIRTGQYHVQTNPPTEDGFAPGP